MNLRICMRRRSVVVALLVSLAGCTLNLPTATAGTRYDSPDPGPTDPPDEPEGVGHQGRALLMPRDLARIVVTQQGDVGGKVTLPREEAPNVDVRFAEQAFIATTRRMLEDLRHCEFVFFE